MNRPSAMDTSNPVVPQDRRTIKEIRETQRLRRRQDQRYLSDIARSAQRMYLPVGEVLGEYEVKDICARFRASIPRVPRDKEESLPSVFEKVYDSVPVSGLLNLEGLPLHPAGVNMVKRDSYAVVNVRRMMGGSPAAPLGLKEIAAVMGERVLERKHVYTCGTWKGFMTRLEQQMGRECVSVYEMYERELGYKPSQEHMFKQLDILFPRKKSDWPVLDEDLGALLDRVSFTASSSAGPPYWRNKGECIDDIIDAGLPIVVKAIKEDKLNDLWMTNPEMFLCEVKNKMDRYEIQKLDEKTRPYACIPGHWAALFSVLTQKFQSGLETFDENPRSVNAYGFSAANGGLTKMYNWMRQVQQAKYIVYGDDTCLVVRRGADVYRVDPDFKQMDGSLHSADMALVCRWVLRACLKEDGLEKNYFWQAVEEQWESFASDPVFLIDGPEVYKKVRPHGMMSGVPGTTLFDTVKSALAWHVYLTVCDRDRQDPLDEEFCREFMLRNGLVVKEGTFSPAKVGKATPGLTITDHKFLGVQMLVEEYEGELVIVPTIPEDEALEMLVVQKDNPFDKSEGHLTNARRLFDRMRGLYITFGFGMPKIAEAIHNVVNSIDPLAVILVTQLPTGEKPDHILLEDFAYPDSSGFPTREFCLAMYGGFETKDEDWFKIYPTLEPTLQELRKESRLVEQEVKKVRRVTEAGVQSDTVEYVVSTVDVGTQTSYSREFDVLDSPERVQKQTMKKPHPRSEIVDPEGVKKKFLPDSGQSLRVLLEAGPMRVETVCRRLKVGVDRLEKDARKYAVYATGFSKDDVLSLAPIQTPASTLQEEHVSHMNKDVVDRGLDFRLAVKREAEKVRGGGHHKVLLRTSPKSLYIEDEFLADIPEPARDPSSVAEAIQMLNPLIAKNPLLTSMRWRTIDSNPALEEPVGVVLEVMVENTWYPVAMCRSLNKKLCQGYMAREIFRAKGHPPQSDIYSVQEPQAPVQVSWAEEVEREAGVLVPPEKHPLSDTQMAEVRDHLVKWINTKRQEEWDKWRLRKVDYQVLLMNMMLLYYQKGDIQTVKNIACETMWSYRELDPVVNKDVPPPPEPFSEGYKPVPMPRSRIPANRRPPEVVRASREGKHWPREQLPTDDSSASSDTSENMKDNLTKPRVYLGRNANRKNEYQRQKDNRKRNIRRRAKKPPSE